MCKKKINKSFTLAPIIIKKLEEEKNSSALVDKLLHNHFENESKQYEQKILESEVIGLDNSIKRTLNDYFNSLELNEQGEFTESEQSLTYMKNLKEVFFNAYDELTVYTTEELLKAFIVNHRIGLNEADFPYGRISSKHHENNWEVLRHVHCLQKYFSDKRYFTRASDNVTKHFALYFANVEYHANVYSKEDDIESEAKATKRYFTLRMFGTNNLIRNTLRRSLT
ncbi:hypothetical protein [Sporosarcina psychrophila]|uniref:Uncharacterized protein n=1 Tax=Sporosarcina psychrophila TaxID=1476 RepID=A0ABV2KBY6_SPOPS